MYAQLDLSGVHTCSRSMPSALSPEAESLEGPGTCLGVPVLYELPESSQERRWGSEVVGGLPMVICLIASAAGREAQSGRPVVAHRDVLQR